MKNIFATVVAVAIATTATFATDAEAKRLGGGTSSGLKRDSTVMNRSATPAAPTQNTAGKPAPAPAAAPAPAPAPQPSGMSRWLGPIAGIAAGLGIAALLSHFGMGAGVANFLMIALLVFAVIFAIRFFFRKKEESSGMQYAGAGAPYAAPERVEPNRFEPVGGTAGGSSVATQAANIPADFDVEGFVRQAKLNYIRLQAANDRGDMDDIRNFTSPEMFAEIQMQYEERGRSKQETDVQQLEAVVLDVSEEAGRHVVSVRFSGRIREEAGGPVEALDEVWHLTKPKSGDGGWVVAGIQQFQ